MIYPPNLPLPPEAYPGGRSQRFEHLRDDQIATYFGVAEQHGAVVLALPNTALAVAALDQDWLSPAVPRLTLERQKVATRLVPYVGVPRYIWWHVLVVPGELSMIAPPLAYAEQLVHSEELGESSWFLTGARRLKPAPHRVFADDGTWFELMWHPYAQTWVPLSATRVMEFYARKVRYEHESRSFTEWVGSFIDPA